MRIHQKTTFCVLHSDKTNIQLEITEPMKTYSLDMNILAWYIVFQIFWTIFWETLKRKCPFFVLHSYNSKIHQKLQCNTQIENFSVDFAQRWWRISETTYHAKISGSQEFVVKDLIILGFHRKNTSVLVGIQWKKIKYIVRWLNPLKHTLDILIF